MSRKVHSHSTTKDEISILWKLNLFTDVNKNAVHHYYHFHKLKKLFSLNTNKRAKFFVKFKKEENEECFYCVIKCMRLNEDEGCVIVKYQLVLGFYAFHFYTKRGAERRAQKINDYTVLCST